MPLPRDAAFVLMPRALFLSPHFDDVAFSCGGTLRALSAGGWETTLCTVFTRSVPDPTGFALACQLDKGLGPQIDYLTLRRAEDDAAAAILGAARVERLDLAEAPHRGYHSAAALFGAFADSDDIATELGSLLELRLPRYDVIFAPLALGNHADHRRVRDAVSACARTRTLDERIVWYRDVPYVVRQPQAFPARGIVAAFPATFAFALDDTSVDAKLDACAAYASQLGMQFGSEAAMRVTLRNFAFAEGARLGLDRESELFRSRDSGILSDA